jgi:hypothetical protein
VIGPLGLGSSTKSTGVNLSPETALLNNNPAPRSKSNFRLSGIMNSKKKKQEQGTKEGLKSNLFSFVLYFIVLKKEILYEKRKRHSSHHSAQNAV